MKKSSSIVVAVVVIAVVAGGAYALFHKSSDNTSTAKTSSSSSAPAVNNSVLITKTGSSGQYLADPSGKALYTYGADTSGVSNCTGSCLSAWPAYVDKGSTSNLPSGVGTITRKDNGQVQYTYNGLPLYYFASDSNGQPTGDGVDNFKLAKPAASSSSSSSSSSSPSSSGSSSGSSNYNY